MHDYWLQFRLVTDALQTLLQHLEDEIHFLRRGILTHEANPEDLIRGRTKASGYFHTVSEKDFSIKFEILLHKKYGL